VVERREERGRRERKRIVDVVCGRWRSGGRREKRKEEEKGKVGREDECAIRMNTVQKKSIEAIGGYAW